MQILITGAGGMLALDVALAAQRAGHRPIALPRSSLDIADCAAVQACLSHRPDAIVNCAAFTDVDGAEARQEQAFAVNAAGAGNLARVAASAGIPMVHVSTDYVFGGSPPLDAAHRVRAYLESDPPAPLNVYGHSKLEGERLVLGASPKHLVVRSSWLFGLGGPNFAARMLELAQQRDHVEVVDDQVGSPTWTGHLAPALIGLLERQVAGLVHLAGAGHVSWNGFAIEIFRQAECECEVRPTTTDALGRAARRPAFSAIESERGEVIAMPDWRDGLAGYLAARAGMIRA